MINLKLNIIEKRRMEGWPSQADRNRSDHLIFDVANDKQDPVPEEPREFLTEWGMFLSWSPSQASLSSAVKPFLVRVVSCAAGS